MRHGFSVNRTLPRSFNYERRSEMKAELMRYFPIARFLKQSLGERFRVFLVDADNLNEPIRFSEEGLLKETPGEDEVELLAEILQSTALKTREAFTLYKGNDEDLAAEKKSILSIRNAADEIVGFLCLFEKQGNLFEVRDVLDQILSNGDVSEEKGSERIAREVNAQLRERVAEVWMRHKSAGETMRKAEKVAFVSELFEMGLFRIKGAAELISNITGISQASLYRYLSEVID